MTLGIVLACNDGVVVGSDRKTVQNKGVTIQSKTNKIDKFSLGDSEPILCCTAGASTVASRMLSHIDPRNLDKEQREGIDFPQFMTEVVEREIPKFAREYQSKHGDSPKATLALGGIHDGTPIGATVYPNGTFDYEDSYTAIGSGSLIAEIFLRDEHCQNLDLEQGRKLVGYIIQRVSEVDSDVEGVDVRSINGGGSIETINPQYLTALKSLDVLDFNFDMNIPSHVAQLEEIAEGFNPADQLDSPDSDAN